MILILDLTSRQRIAAARRAVRLGLHEGWLTRPEFIHALANLEEAERGLPPDERVWTVEEILQREG